MKKQFIAAFTLMSLSVFAAEPNSLEFPTGTHKGLTSQGEKCALVIEDTQDNEDSSCKYMISFQENGYTLAQDFCVLKENYGIEHNVQKDGVYFTKLTDKRFGGIFHDDLSLEFDKSGDIKNIHLDVEARFLKRAISSECKLEESISYSVK